MWQILILFGMLLSAVMAIRAKKLLVSALWLAGASALVALWMYMLGAPEIAVIELSVGAGLVTVLFVFAINISGDEDVPVKAPISRTFSWLLIVVSIGLLAWFNLSSGLPSPVAGNDVSFRDYYWQNRIPDVMLQLVFIFAGALGILGLLAEGKNHDQKGEN